MAIVELGLKHVKNTLKYGKEVANNVYQKRTVSKIGNEAKQVYSKRTTVRPNGTIETRERIAIKGDDGSYSSSTNKTIYNPSTGQTQRYRSIDYSIDPTTGKKYISDHSKCKCDYIIENLPNGGKKYTIYGPEVTTIHDGNVSTMMDNRVHIEN